jgi:hypothetical protein
MALAVLYVMEKMKMEGETKIMSHIKCVKDGRSMIILYILSIKQGDDRQGT